MQTYEMVEARAVELEQAAREIGNPYSRRWLLERAAAVRQVLTAPSPTANGQGPAPPARL